MYPPPPGDFVGDGDGLTHYMSWGEGDRVLLVLHKVTGGGETWLPVLKKLALKYRIIAPDLLGHGYSGKPNRGYSLDDYCRQIVAFISELNLDSPLVMGHSLGARVALVLASKHAQAVGAMVCIEPPLSGPSEEPYPYDLKSVLDWRKNVLNEGADYCLRTNSNYTIEEAELRARYGGLCEEQVLREAWEGFSAELMDDYARALTCPTMLLYGDQGVISNKQAEHFSSLNQGIRLRQLAGCSHNPPWENNDLFHLHVETFLEEFA